MHGQTRTLVTLSAQPPPPPHHPTLPHFRPPSPLSHTHASFDSVDACVSPRGFCGPSYLAATCSVLCVALERLKMRIFWENIPVYFRIQRFLARQWNHLWRQSTWLRYFTYFLRESELVSCGHLRCCFSLSTETGLHSANCAKAGDSTVQFVVGR